MCVFIYTYNFFSIYKWSHTLFYAFLFLFFLIKNSFVDVSMEDFSTLIPHIVFQCLAFIYRINDLLRFVRWASPTRYEIHFCKMYLCSIWAFINISISIIRTWYLEPKKTTHFKVWWEYVETSSKATMLYVKNIFLNC